MSGKKNWVGRLALSVVILIILGPGKATIILIWIFVKKSFFFFSWSSYKINQTQDKIGVFVSIVSTKIPFKGTGKEYIGDDIKEIASAVKVRHLLLLLTVFITNLTSNLTTSFLQSAIQQCCIQLKSKIVRKIQAREQQERKRNLSR